MLGEIRGKWQEWRFICLQRLKSYPSDFNKKKGWIVKQGDVVPAVN